ncbi:MAG: FAD-linked oxidase C-terminal domain-containing protein [Anaerolineales bacterium]|nr:MAG: FAD-linked oxidase C-terminal domain-containing protein [Anaerolineales bacterium]
MNPDFLNELKKRFTGDLRLDSASKVLYATDASIYQIEPLGVAIPKTQEDLHAAVELAAKYKIPILPRGSGSSLAGQAIGEALILDCSRWLDSIVEINPEEHYAVVEPGVILSNLNRAAAKHGLTFGPDPASAERATMGGVIGNNATGAHSILYGMSADHLLEADVILGDGSLAVFGEWKMENGNERLTMIHETIHRIRENYAQAIKRNYPRSWRNSAGYRINYLLPWSPSMPPQWIGENYPANLAPFDAAQGKPDSWNLAPLLAGSEGTLAVSRRMKVNLVPRLKQTMLGVLSYDSIAEACDDVPRLLEFNPSAVELIPQMILHLARSIPAYARQMGWVAGDPAAVLVVEFSGSEPQKLKEQVRGLDEISTTSRLLTIAEFPEEQARIWNIRKVGLGILDSRPQSARPLAFIEDCAIPVEKLGDFVREVERILDAHGTYGGMYAHASAGCLHIRPVLDVQRSEGVRAMRSISGQVFALTMSLGGSMSSEHGDGLARGEYIERTYGNEVSGAMRLLKRAADPHNILNPKKMFDAPPMDTHLRYDPHFKPQVWKPVLHFEHERGLAGAIESCNGQGVCRKSTGVMCPSFQATREEGLSTRGRANLLRGLMTSNELEPAVFQTLDLCLACKGCTSECPSGVDMPKLKYEFMNEYFKTHRRPLRDYLFGYFHIVAKWLSPIAPLANWFMRMGWSRTLIARTLGLAEQRPFPRFAGSRLKPDLQTGHSKSVIFLSDVFSHYIESEVEEAAVFILNKLGYEVMILPVIGAGASLLSKGFIPAAQRHAENVLGEIKRLGGEAGIPVVGCEPPEVYCLKHEYKSLLPGRREEIQSIAQRVWLLDEFVLRVARSGLDIPKASNVAQKLTFHPHCHQRAEGPADDGLPSGVSATVEMLKVFGFDVEVIDAGCCGMAGTFGYDAEHYELSMRVGELGVFPKIREQGIVNSGLVSSGAACRLQIQHGAGVEARHPLLVVRDVMRKGNATLKI